MMLTHESFWNGIDELAKRQNTSLTEAARQAQMDKTSLLPSKRFTEGKKGKRPKWPSVETLAKLINGHGIDLVSFAEMVEAPNGRQAPKAEQPSVESVAVSSLRAGSAFLPEGSRDPAAWEETNISLSPKQPVWGLRIDQAVGSYAPGCLILLDPVTTLLRHDDPVVLVGGENVDAGLFDYFVKDGVRIVGEHRARTLADWQVHRVVAVIPKI